MDGRVFARASGGVRRSIRQVRNQERRIALQRRWHVGALAAVVAGALVFSGMAPAVADEGVTPTTTEETTAQATTGTEAPAEEPAAPTEDPAAPADEAAAEEPPAEHGH